MKHVKPHPLELVIITHLTSVDIGTFGDGSESNNISECKIKLFLVKFTFLALNETTEKFKNNTKTQREHLSKENDNNRNTDSLIESLGLGQHYLTSRSSMFQSSSPSGNNENGLLRRKTKGLK